MKNRRINYEEGSEKAIRTDRQKERRPGREASKGEISKLTTRGTLGTRNEERRVEVATKAE